MITIGTRREKVYEYNVRFFGIVFSFRKNLGQSNISAKMDSSIAGNVIRRFNVGSHLRAKNGFMPCICKCQKEERERQEQRMKEEEQLLYVRRLKAAGIQERHLQDWTFASAIDTPSVQMAKRYVENWKKVKAENLGLLFWGDVGTGKSFLAACIANALLEKGVPVLMTNFSKILNQMGAMYSDERYRYIASLNRFSLLIIDDLGIERNTEYALETGLRCC